MLSHIEYEEYRAIDGRGIPTTYLSFLVLRRMFENPRQDFTVHCLSELLAFKLSDVSIVCHGLSEGTMITEVSSAKYRYNLACTDPRQVAFESYLVDVATNYVRVDSILDYSPSHPFPVTPKMDLLC